MSLNKVTLIGNLGADPEPLAMPNNGLVTRFSIATNTSYTDDAGVKQTNTEWHRVSFFGGPAESIRKYCKKGNRLYVEGRLRTNKYTDKNGVEKYSTEIVGDKFLFLDGKAQQPEQLSLDLPEA